VAKEYAQSGIDYEKIESFKLAMVRAGMQDMNL